MVVQRRIKATATHRKSRRFEAAGGVAHGRCNRGPVFDGQVDVYMRQPHAPIPSPSLAHNHLPPSDCCHVAGLCHVALQHRRVKPKALLRWPLRPPAARTTCSMRTCLTCSTGSPFPVPLRSTGTGGRGLGGEASCALAVDTMLESEFDGRLCVARRRSASSTSAGCQSRADSEASQMAGAWRAFSPPILDFLTPPLVTPQPCRGL